MQPKSPSKNSLRPNQKLKKRRKKRNKRSKKRKEVKKKRRRMKRKKKQMKKKSICPTNKLLRPSTRSKKSRMKKVKRKNLTKSRKRKSKKKLIVNTKYHFHNSLKPLVNNCLKAVMASLRLNTNSWKNKRQNQILNPNLLKLMQCMIWHKKAPVLVMMR